MEQILLVGLVLLSIGQLGYIFYLHREMKRREEEWEDRIYSMKDQSQKRIDRLLEQIKEEFHHVDENAQKRYNYMKKAFNDLADRLDIVEQTEKRAKDLYYQLERYNIKLDELMLKIPKQDQSKQDRPLTPPQDEEVRAVLDLHKDGLTAEAIARKLGRAVPEIQLILDLYQ